MDASEMKLDNICGCGNFKARVDCILEEIEMRKGQNSSK
jgi:hypothetical protein